MKRISLYLIIVLSLVILTGCNNDNTRKESVFECFDLEGDGHQQDVTLTYEENENGTRIFYDGDTKIGTRGEAIDYASSKTGGMTCKAGTDREKK